MFGDILRFIVLGCVAGTAISTVLIFLLLWKGDGKLW